MRKLGGRGAGTRRSDGDGGDACGIGGGGRRFGR
jgi:hypothetical protein